jgi:hypothetical protein
VEGKQPGGPPTLAHAVDMGGNITLELLISGLQVQSLRE